MRRGFRSYKRLEQESGNTGNPIKDYSTTLLVSIVKKFAQGTFVASSVSAMAQ
jgi:hypothetical protein